MYAAKWAYGTRMPVLDVRTWPRGDVPRLEVDRLGRRSSKGVDCDILTQGLIGFDRIFIPPRYTFFVKAHLQKNYGRAWPRAISGWVTNREVFSGVHK
jgi:hypothetical protein